MTEDSPRRLKRVVTALAVIYVMTFLSGFLQDTRLNFFNYIFFFLLFIGGIGLVKVTARSKAAGVARGFSFLTGSSAISLAILFVGYEWSRLGGLEDIAASIEALLYLVTLFFWIAVIGSLILIGSPRGPVSSQ